MITCTKYNLATALVYGYYESALSLQQFKEIGNSVEYADPPKTHLKDLVCKHIADNMKAPISLLFSGGVDSTFMLCMAREVFQDKDIVPVTVGFDSTCSEFDETAKAFSVLEAMRFRGQSAAISSFHPVGVVKSFNEENYKNLFFSSSIVPTYTAMYRASEHSNNILTGDGGDEMFGGYDRYLWTMLCSKHPILARAISLIKGNDKTSRGRKFLNVLNYRDNCTIWTKKQAAELTGVSSLTMENFNEVDKRYNYYLGTEDSELRCLTFDNLMMTDIATELYGVELYKVQQAYRMIGLKDNQVVSPLMHIPIVKYCMALPDEMKINFNERKILMRQIIKEQCPNYDKIAGKKKKGFGAPVSKWMKDIDIVTDSKVINRVISNYASEHRLSKKDHGERLWAVYVLSYLLNHGIVKVED